MSDEMKVSVERNHMKSHFATQIKQKKCFWEDLEMNVHRCFRANHGANRDGPKNLYLTLILVLILVLVELWQSI